MTPSNEAILALLDRLDAETADDLESQQLEFKPWQGAKDDLKVAVEYVACFANAEGGVVVFGVADKVRGRAQAIHGAVGYDLDAWRRGIFERTSPHVSAEVEELPVPEGTGRLLLVRTPKGVNPPYGTSQGLFKHRVGKNCMPLHPSEFLRRQVETAAVDWSGMPAQDVVLGDLDRLEIERARAMLRSKNPSSALLNLSEQEFLAGLEAIRDGRVTHTGLLLFAKPEVLARACPQAQFHYVHQANETAVTRNDVWREPLLLLIERMEQVFSGPANPEQEVSLGFFKLRIPDFPLDAVREAVLNALSHRDYAHPGEILLRHTPQELLITSPGGFIGGITPQNVLRHEPISRNRTLANAFVKLRLVESAGVGRKRIFRETLRYGKRLPRYESSSSAVTLRLFNSGASPQLAALVSRLDAQHQNVGLDTLLLLDAFRDRTYLDAAEAALVLQLSREEARMELDALSQPPLSLIERKGHTLSATYYLAKGIAKELKGKAAYTKSKGLNPVRYAEMVREYLRDHRTITNHELRELLGLGDSKSAGVEASRYLRKWSGDAGFLERLQGSPPKYRLRQGSV
jgi:ATP-dependent DNA helicase RecG